ncbi:unnamed protein product [Clavelina lepadiformis]|uniref:TELO2-interacting protein 2 n=1 Tax=Clavelina lepadiformis TaxID=159417 RepID=A0ABP0FB01_CLALP
MIAKRLEEICTKLSRASLSKIDEENEILSFCDEVLNDKIVASPVIDNHDDLILFVDHVGNLLTKSLYLVELEPLTIGDAESGEYTFARLPLIHYRLEKLCAMTSKVLSGLPESSKSYTSLVLKKCGSTIAKTYYIYGDEKVKWSTKKCSESVQKLLHSFLCIADYKSLKECLNDIPVSCSLHQQLLKQFLPYMTRERWQLYPAICHAFKKFLLCIDGDALCEILPMILPTILLFTDDYQPFNALNGLNLLHLVLSNVPAAEIRMCGWAEVIHDAISKKLYMREPEIVDHTLLCLLLSLKVLERNPAKPDQCHKITQYDKIFQTIISCINTCTDPKLQRVFWKHMSSYSNVLGITVAKHFRDLIPAIEYQLDTQDEKLLVLIFQTIQTLVQVAWMRMGRHSPPLLKQLIKSMIRLNNTKQNTRSCLQELSETIVLLSTCDNGVCLETLSQLKASPELEKHYTLITDLLDAASVSQKANFKANKCTANIEK